MVIRFRQVLSRISRTGPPGAEPTDADLLDRFRMDRSEEAFAGLVRRHGPMVFGVCRRMLANWHDAEDAFQATFLVLACKPDAVRPAGRLGAWLHGVACHVARKARRTAARRSGTEAHATALHPRVTEAADPLPDDVRELIDESLLRLPEKYRSAVVVCDLEGLSRKDAADRLGWSEGTLSGRLARARKLLADRLTRRGVALGAGGIGAVLSALAAPAAVAGELAASTVTAVALVAGGLSGLPAGPVAALAHGVARSMFLTRLKLTAAGLLGAGLVAAGIGSAFFPASAATPASTRFPARPALASVSTVADAAKPGWREKVTVKADAAVSAVAFGPDVIATGDADGNVVLWDALTGQEKEKLIDVVKFNIPNKLPTDGLAFNTDGTWLYIVNMERSALHACRLDPANRLFPGVGGPPRVFGFAPDGSVYFSAAGDKRTVRFFDNEFPDNKISSMVVADLKHDAEVTWAAMSDDSKRVATATADGTVWLWDYGTQKVLWSAKREATALAIAPGGKAVAAAGADGTVRLFDGQTGKETAKLAGHDGTVTAVAFSPDGKTLASAGHDKTVRLWDVATGKERAALKGHADAVTGVAFSLNGTMVVTGSADKTAKVWEFKP